MKLNEQQIKNIATGVGIILGGIFVYKIAKGSKPKQAVKESITEPIKVVEDVAGEVVKGGKKALKYLKKGSQEAKDHMAKLRAKRGKKKSSKKKSSNKKIPSKKSIEKKLDALHEKALKSYDQGKMKEGKIFESQSDTLYKKYYHILHPKKAKKLNIMLRKNKNGVLTK